MQEKESKEKEIINEAENTENTTAVNTEEQAADSAPELSIEEQLTIELANEKDKNLRLFAEFDNYKRRTTKERIELFKNASQEVLTALLPVMDDFDRALKAASANAENTAIIEGITLIHNKLKTITQKQGLKEMEAIGQEFDPELHEAITNIPAPTEELKGKVVDEVEKGYYLNEKVIRHAKVVVGN